LTNVFGERLRQPNAQNPITMRFRATMCHGFHLPDVDATQIRSGSPEQGVLHFEEKCLFLLSVWSQDSFRKGTDTSAPFSGVLENFLERKKYEQGA